MKRNGPAAKNKKYLAILLVVIMVFSAFVIFFGNSLKTGSNNDFSTKAVEDNSSSHIPFSQIPGKHINHKFNSIVDGLNMSPEGIMSAIYIDLQKSKGTPLETLFKSKDLKDFYGVDVTKVDVQIMLMKKPGCF